MIRQPVYDPRTKPPVGVMINPEHPYAPGLLACWLFNEGSGRVIQDVSMFRKHASLPITSENLFKWGTRIGFGLSARPGQYATGLSLYNNPGFSRSVSFPLVTIETGQDFTYESRFIWSSDSASYATLCTAGVSIGVWVRILLGLGYFDWYLGGDHYSIAVLQEGVEYHACVIAKAGTVKLYLNGQFDTTLMTGFSSSVPFNTMMNDAFNDFLVGTIIYTRLWNRALPLSAAMDLYMKPYEMFVPASALFWFTPRRRRSRVELVQVI